MAVYISTKRKQQKEVDKGLLKMILEYSFLNFSL